MPSLRAKRRDRAGGGAEHREFRCIERRAHAGRVLRDADAAQHRIDGEDVVAPAHLGDFQVSDSEIE